MATEMSRGSLEFPDELSTILATINCQQLCKPVWTFSRHANGYSLKLFWSSQPQSAPIDAHSVTFGRKSRSKRRMDAFLAKKRSAVPTNTQTTACDHDTQPTEISGIPEPRQVDRVSAAPKIKSSVVENAKLGSIPDRSVAESAQHLSCDHDTQPTEVSGIPEPRQVDRVSAAPSKSTAPQPLYIPSDAHLLEPVSSPIASRTRNRQAAKHVLTGSDVAVTNATSDSAYEHIPALKLPEHLKDITKHHEDFVRCEDVSTADAVKDAMKLQWSDLIFPGQKVKLKVKEEIISAEVEKCHFVSKLSFDCLYYYATAKADVRVPGFGLTKEYQFRDLLLYVM